MDLAFTEATRSIVATVARRATFFGMIQRITSRTLLLHGEGDRVVDVASARAAHERCPHLELVVLDEVGHVPQIETPERFLSVVIPWLEGSISPTSS